MKKMFIVLSLLITVSYLYTDEKPAFQWQPFKNHLEFVNINPNILFLDTDVNNSFAAFTLLNESDWHKSFKDIINSENKSNNTVAVQNGMSWVEFFILMGGYTASLWVDDYNNFDMQKQRYDALYKNLEENKNIKR
jgi:hypothetical protein